MSWRLYVEALATPGPIFLTADTASDGVGGTRLVLQCKDYYRKKVEESGTRQEVLRKGPSFPQFNI